jgi:NAD(P) transhydrogenase subunit beta
MPFYQHLAWIQAWYIVAFVLFIYGVSGVTKVTTARHGNLIAAVGVLIAFLDTLGNPKVNNYLWLVVGLAIGTAVGIPAARLVKMTQMPQMVALFNGVGGGAVALITWVEFRKVTGGLPLHEGLFEYFAAIIGAISFFGSLIAFGKLQEILPGRPIQLPRQIVFNIVFVGAAVALWIWLLTGESAQWVLILMLVVASVAGCLLVLPIGGADMPVVISGLNAFTGLSAAGTGIALGNTALIVAGTLVGASGTILTQLMAKAMNRSIPAIAAGGFGGSTTAGSPGGGDRPVNRTDAQDAALTLSRAGKVVVVPGYGLAVAQAQRAVADLAGALEACGVDVSYAIHPVAGRMPGHMNVLLAEVDVDYERLKEMEVANREFAETDVVLVLGANDVINPAARDDAGSPIYGMPILNVDEARQVMIIKRSLSPGFAGVDNELFYAEGTQMLFADAKKAVTDIQTELTEALQTQT